MVPEDESKESLEREEKDGIETTSFYDWASERRERRRRHTIHIAAKVDFPPPFDWTKIDGSAIFDWAKAANVRDGQPHQFLQQRLSFLLQEAGSDTDKETNTMLKEKPGFNWAEKWPQETSAQKQVPSFDWGSLRRQRLRKTQSFSDALDVVQIVPVNNAIKRGKPRRGPPSFNWTNERFDWSQQSPRYDWSQSARFADEKFTKDQVPVRFDWSKAARLSAPAATLPERSLPRANISGSKGDKQPTLPRRGSISS